MNYKHGRYCEVRWVLRDPLPPSKNRKIRDSEVRTIRRRHNSGRWRVTDLAEHYGTTTGHISNILAGRRRVDVT